MISYDNIKTLRDRFWEYQIEYLYLENEERKKIKDCFIGQLIDLYNLSIKEIPPNETAILEIIDILKKINSPLDAVCIQKPL